MVNFLTEALAIPYMHVEALWAFDKLKSSMIRIAGFRNF